MNDPDSWWSLNSQQQCWDGTRSCSLIGLMKFDISKRAQYCWWFRNSANQLRLVVYTTIYKVYTFWWLAGFLPSIVWINAYWFCMSYLQTTNLYTPWNNHRYCTRCSSCKWISKLLLPPLEIRKFFKIATCPFQSNNARVTPLIQI